MGFRLAPFLLLFILTWRAVTRVTAASFLPSTLNVGFEYIYSYESTGHLHESDELTTSARFSVTPLNASADGSTTCRLAVLAFSQRSKRMGDDFSFPLPVNSLDFKGWFSFTVAASGGVSDVHYPASETAEVIMFKKAFVGMFSSKLQNHPEHAGHEIPADGAQWQYDADDVDHTGGERGGVYERERERVSETSSLTRMPHRRARSRVLGRAQRGSHGLHKDPQARCLGREREARSDQGAESTSSQSRPILPTLTHIPPSSPQDHPRRPPEKGRAGGPHNRLGRDR